MKKNHLKLIITSLTVLFSIIVIFIVIILLKKQNSETNTINESKNNNIIDIGNKKEDEETNISKSLDNENSSTTQKADKGEIDPWGENNPITEEDLKLKYVTDSYSYFMAKQCITNFYSSKEKAYNVLPNELRQYDISNFYGIIEEPTFSIDKIIKSDVSLSKDIYVVYYRLEIGNGQCSNLYNVVKVDKKNLTFEIYPYEYLRSKNIVDFKENDIIPRDIIKLGDIDRTEYNHYRIDDIKTTEIACIREVFERCKFDYDFDKKQLYTVLNEQYKNEKFPNIEDFLDYLNRSNIFKGNIQKYQSEKVGDRTQYIVLGSYDNYYVINYNNILNYDLILDEYSILSQKYLEVYNSNFPTVQAKYCIDRIRRAINDKNYRFIYEKYAPVLRNKNFLNYNDFENFIKQKFYEQNSFEYIDFERISDSTYRYQIKITDESGKDFSYRQIKITVTLKENADFEISISQ